MLQCSKGGTAGSVSAHLRQTPRLSWIVKAYRPDSYYSLQVSVDGVHSLLWMVDEKFQGVEPPSPEGRPEIPTAPQASTGWNARARYLRESSRRI